MLSIIMVIKIQSVVDDWNVDVWLFEVDLNFNKEYIQV